MKKTILITLCAFFFFAAFANAQDYTFNNDLLLGSSGSDVSALQTWLIANDFDIPSVNSGGTPKGYFGPQTKAALISYQKSVGLASNGFFGPLTRSRLNRGGGGRIIENLSFAVTSPNGGETWQRGMVRNITWTGAPGLMSQRGSIRLEIPQPACAQSYPTQCMIATQAPYVIADNVDLSRGSYQWVVGNIMNYSGANVTAADGQYKVQICLSSGSQCYESSSLFTITSNVIPVTNSPIINGMDAPTALNIGQTGTWTIRATDPQNSQLSYYIDWGDVIYAVSANAYSPSTQSFTQTTTFTHSYASAGNYTVRATVRNSAGLTAQTSATVQVSSPYQAGSFQVTSPNGGEVWQKGSVHSITWTSPYYYSATTADIKLIPYQLPCTSQACPTIAYMPYTIVTGLSINQNSYSWNVGNAYNTVNGYTTSSGSSISVPDGQYTVQICQTGTNNCDSSNAPFTISSVSTTNLPDINIISPNGGETLTAGSNQNVVVSITGDTSKIGNDVDVFLADPTNNGVTKLGSFTQNISYGYKTFNVYIPSNTVSGNYKMYVTLNNGLVSTPGFCPPGYAGCTWPPNTQAYDFSDAFFRVVNGYIYPIDCPVGYTCTPNR